MALASVLKLSQTSLRVRSLSVNTVVRCDEVKTAGILVIGDEILKGEISDKNSPHMTRQLHNLGVKVKKISIVGDVVDEISSEVNIFSKFYNYVITTGGIGPTHDDVTFESVAKAFNVPLLLNPYLADLCEKFYKNTNKNQCIMKHAMVPKTAKLNFAPGINYPNVSVENVYMFPGVPQLFLKSFTALSKTLFNASGVIFYTKYIYVNLTEDQISQELCDLIKEFPMVQVGSYPKLFDKSYKVKITIESTNEIDTNAAYEKLLEKLPQEVIVSLKKIKKKD